MQDTRTPPLLDAIYEQITRSAAGYSELVCCSDLSDENNKSAITWSLKDQVISDYSLGYSLLAAQLSAHELDLRHAPMRRENQELDVSISVQRIHAESSNSQESQNLHRQLELSRAHEQKLHADLLASEQERERLIALVSTLENSRRDMHGWKEIAGIAKSLFAESEMTVSNLRADLVAATDTVRDVQEQLVHQIEISSGKDSIIQSITIESRLAHTRLKIVRDMIKRSDAKLLEERDRRNRETDGLLHEKAMIEDRYESEIRRLTQEAQDAQEQLNALRDTLYQLHADRQPPLDHYQPPTTWPFDTGQPPLPPEWNLIGPITDTPVGSAIDSDSSHRSTEWSQRSPIQDPMNSSTRLAARILEIPVSCDQESKVAKGQRAALLEQMGQMEPESAEDVEFNERGDTGLQEELITTREQLRLAEEEVRDLRRELGQSRESLREVETHVRALEYELDICRATVREAQDAQHASEVKFTEATQLLRVHQAESESSRAKAEESQLKCSQATFLYAALRESVTELEAKLKSARKYRAQSNSLSRRPTGTCTGMLTLVLNCLVCIVYSYFRALYQISKQLNTTQKSESPTPST